MPDITEYRGVETDGFSYHSGIVCRVEVECIEVPDETLYVRDSIRGDVERNDDCA